MSSAPNVNVHRCNYFVLHKRRNYSELYWGAIISSSMRGENLVLYRHNYFELWNQRADQDFSTKVLSCDPGTGAQSPGAGLLYPGGEAYGCLAVQKGCDSIRKITNLWQVVIAWRSVAGTCHVDQMVMTPVVVTLHVTREQMNDGKRQTTSATPRALQNIVCDNMTQDPLPKDASSIKLADIMTPSNGNRLQRAKVRLFHITIIHLVPDLNLDLIHVREEGRIKDDCNNKDDLSFGNGQCGAIIQKLGYNVPIIVCESVAERGLNEKCGATRDVIFLMSVHM
ncbi:uncharacterized protein LACBIDRAFT_324767 [Laccaria bicolor S238N-H82]|uniref:Predicted protein n=1 Tax=Laccaria bicolor (strain S238N-H82 / ATCC MYA-4686) TaxID=486041 RepID=B0D2Z4_LACBS|nr:uncharacterized protein LACBIDRAFT_324767 [Laccaria bicolor S238N-H82]EDR10836.1 predicted protein [Laccaria bicolor S238N-H82]|eukprot:XP_001878137.1 predicted protein [Laccaria bicolor S238N-H82]